MASSQPRTPSTVDAYGALVVATKLRPPLVHGALIQRPWLLDRLRAGRDRTLTLVCAPAGYGKSTLLAQWVAADRARTPFVWVSLDSHDEDPARLWKHIVDGLHVVHPRVGEGTISALTIGPEAITRTVLPQLIEELADAPRLVLVLDDWQLAQNPRCDESLSEFVEGAPPEVQVVVSSRAEPGLPTGRLRAHGDLAEVRARHLRVSPEEAFEVFRESGVDLEPDHVRRITEKTEGWLAGIYLALLGIRDAPDPAAFVARFTGDTQQVFEYLRHDVLAAAAPEVRTFLLRTSVLDSLSAPLCDAVLRTTGSGDTLEKIARLNLFLVRLDETGLEYRYHQLFAAVLRRELEATDAAVLPELHARASAWHEERGDIEHAVQHAIASRDLERASALVTRSSVSLISVGRSETVNRWLEALSWPAAETDPQLGITRALAAGMSGRGRDEIERWLGVAAGPDIGPLANGISSLRSAVAMIRSLFLTRGIAEAERGARYVLEHEPDGSPWRYAGLVPLGQALFLQGRYEEAKAPLAEARALPGAHRLASTSVGMAYLALIDLEAGDVASCERLARAALDLAAENGHSSDVTAANPHLALGRVLMQGSDLHTAIDHLERAVELTAPLDSPYWHVHALVHLAAARHQLGDAQGAQDVLERARAELSELPDAGMLIDLLSATEDDLADRPRREGFLGDELSEAELKVLRGFASGASLGEVARDLFLSPNTVKTHRRSIYRKLGISTREELIEHAATLDPMTGPATDTHSG
jgi:LuxR family maltose regulon positive regulatory protein